MDICSTFLFSGREEVELLFLKLATESKYVKSWIAVEGAFTFRGEPKSLSLRGILEQDPRFEAYSKRVTVIEINENLFEKYSYPKLFRFRKKLEISLRKILKLEFETNLRKYQEMPNFFVERQSRNIALTRIFETTNPETDWVFISDVDEILNLETIEIQNALRNCMLEDSNFLLLNRLRFVFDFDNLDGQQRFTPLVRISYLLQNTESSLAEFRERVDGIPLTEHPYVVEYSYCLSKQGIYEKLESFAHLSPPLEQIELALKLNHNFVYSDKGTLNLRWLTKVDVMNMQVPEIVKTYLDKLSTGNVNPEYIQARRVKYPSLFSLKRY